MLFEVGHTYHCDFLVDAGLLGKRKAFAEITSDSAGTFRGTANLVDKDLRVAKWKIPAGKKIKFTNGTLRGNIASFTFTAKGISVKFEFNIAADGSFTGRASAVGLIKAKLTGAVREK